jgi:hypothetical protein
MFDDSPASTRLAWVCLLCHVKAQGRAGRAKLRVKTFAASYRLSERSVEDMIQRAQKCAAIQYAEGFLTLCNWQTYQGKTRGVRDPNCADSQETTEFSLPSTGTKHQAPPPSTHSPPGGVSLRFTRQQVESIYDLYPRKIGRSAALKAIDKSIKLIALRGEENPLGFLQDRVLAFAQSPAGQAGKYTPHPATWFNQSRYDDNPAEWRRDFNNGHSDELDFPEHTEEEAVALLRRAAEQNR